MSEETERILLFLLLYIEKYKNNIFQTYLVLKPLLKDIKVSKILFVAKY